MRKLIILLLMLAVAARGEVRRLATNLPADLYGQPHTDTATETLWGHGDSRSHTITFQVPQGQRVRILRVYGDMIAWSRGTPPFGTHCGLLFGIQTTGPDGQGLVDYSSDNTLLYLQDAIAGEPRRTHIDYSFPEAGLLDQDNKLVLKLATYLNDTGLMIHIEVSLVILYQIEAEPNPPLRRR